MKNLLTLAAALLLSFNAFAGDLTPNPSVNQDDVKIVFTNVKDRLSPSLGRVRFTERFRCEGLNFAGQREALYCPDGTAFISNGFLKDFGMTSTAGIRVTSVFVLAEAMIAEKIGAAEYAQIFSRATDKQFQRYITIADNNADCVMGAYAAKFNDGNFAIIAKNRFVLNPTEYSRGYSASNFATCLNLPRIQELKAF